MYGAASVAGERARAGEGPTLIEAMTFRFNGHLIGDAGGYIDKAEYAEALTHDPVPILRSEEHTSELQSLMRISYAVFCLKKKKTYTNRKINQIHNICVYIKKRNLHYNKTIMINTEQKN